MNGYWSTSFTNGAPAWILDRPVILKPRRVVWLVVDMSDSMTSSKRDARQFAAMLSQQLEAGDRCVIWIAGRAEPTCEVEIRHAADRAKIVQALDQANDEPGGSWLAETAEGVQAAARHYANNPYIRQFRFLISDGEFFDAEAVDAGIFRWFRVGTAEHRLRDRATPLAGLRDLLACPLFDVSLAWHPPDAPAWRLSANGATIRLGPPSEPATPIDGGFRLIFGGDVEPTVHITYAAGDLRTTEDVPVSRPLPRRRYGPLQDPRAFRPFELDPRKLAALVTIARDGYRGHEHKLLCGGPCELYYDPTRKLECPVCGNSLLSVDPQPLPDEYFKWCELPILPDGGFGACVETSRRPRGRFEVQTDGNGNALLVLDFLP